MAISTKTVKKPLPTLNGRASTMQQVRATAKPQIQQTNTSLATYKGTVAPAIPLGTKAGYIAQSIPTGKPNLTANVNLGAPVNSLNGQPASNQLTRGVFQNKTTGAYTDKNGNPVDAQGKSLTNQNAAAPSPLGYGDIAKGMLQNQYDATAQTAKDLGLEGGTFTSLEQYTQAQAKRMAQTKAFSESQLNANEQLSQMDAQQSKQALGSQMSANTANLANSREGVTSFSNMSTLQSLRAQNQDQLTRIQIAREQSQAQIDEMRNKLAFAQKEGNQQLAEQYQGQLAAYEQEAKRIDSEAFQAQSAMLSAESDYAKTQSDILQSGLTLFQTAVDTGNEMDYNTVKGYADQLGLPTDMLMGYYQGAQNIRDDKSLDAAGKQLALQQNAQDLQDQIKGLTTEAAKKIDYIDKQTALWREAGYSPDEINAMRSNLRTQMGVEDQTDPAYLADIAYKNAQIAYSQSNTANNYQDLLKKQLDYNESMGYEGGAYLPLSTRGDKYQVTTSTSPDGSTSITVADKDGKPLQPGDYGGQCAAFVNDLFGASVFDDLYTQKLSKVDFGLTTPEVGMAIVLPEKGSYAKYGHVVYVTGVDAQNQQVNYIDSNSHDDETVDFGSITFQNLGQLIANKTGGLVVNPNSTKTGGVIGNSAEGQAISSALNTIKFGTVDQADTAKKEIKNYIKNGDVEGAKSYLKTQVFNNSTGAQQDVLTAKDDSLNALNRIETALNSYVAKGGDLGVFQGLEQKGLEKLGMQTGEGELNRLQNTIALAIIDYRHAVSGAAFTEGEKLAYESVFPSIGKTPELNADKISTLKEKFKNDAESFYRHRIGDNLYDKIFPKPVDTDALYAEAEAKAKQDSVVQDDDMADIDKNW